MRTANTVEMRGDLDHIVALAADTERWPEILPHYRWVTLLEGGGDDKTVEMAAKRDFIPVKWRARQTVERDGETPVIRFHHVGGVTKGMDVAWTFKVRDGAVDVTIDHDFTPPWPVVGNLISDYIIGPQFIEAIAGKTLATIKGIVEDRDSRFMPNGEPRS
ncbi:MAG TPA: SRPBCC family protein [Thermomicrobiales bacterium]|jgi:ribosome-associated toxin RatA of RatAB toxin-antitoxin module|nr:SRPBCC family protein [Thermomicrobiales bacterium]